MTSLNNYKLIGLMGLSFWLGMTLASFSTKNQKQHPDLNQLGFSYQMGQSKLNSPFNPIQKQTPSAQFQTKLVEPNKNMIANPKENTKKIAPNTKSTKSTNTATQPQKRFSSHPVSPRSNLNPITNNLIPNSPNNNSTDHSSGFTTLTMNAANFNNSNPGPNINNLNNKDSDTNYTDAEWRNRLGNEPQRSQLDQLYQSLQSGKVSESFYFSIIQEYLQTKQDKAVKAAFYLLSLNPNATAFEILFEVKSTYPKEAESLLSKYNTVANLSGFAQILNRSSNDDLITYTLQKISIIISKEIIPSYPILNVNESRPTNTNRWSYLIKSLTHVQKTENSPNIGLATQVLQQMSSAIQLANAETQTL